MDHDKQRLLDDLIRFGVESLDLTEAQHADMISKYGAVGRWLDADDSFLRIYSPTIFAQGSAALGTTCRAVGRDEVDIDLVCQMLLPTEISQAAAKALVGKRLRENATYADMLVEKNRCWRLVYAGQFHMDILPAKPDERLPTETSLVVPDKLLRRWKETDPKGYAAWFGVNAAQSRRQDGTLIRAGVEPAPAYVSVWQKAPLQIAVQVLKRHRDIYFDGDKNAPISIIITTLAARAYQGHGSIFATLSHLLEHMPDFIEYDQHGVPYVCNPMNRLENFADKWHKEPQKQAAFDAWIDKAKQDLRSMRFATLNRADEPLGEFFGERVAKQALTKFGERMHKQRQSGLHVATATGALGTAGASAAEIRPNTFYGTQRR